MNAEEKKGLKEKIIIQIDELKLKIDELKDLTKPISPENAIGRISRMDAINNKSVNEAALRASKEKFKRLENALKNIDKPEFGHCIICQQQIPSGRILIMPESVKCVHCASK